MLVSNSTHVANFFSTKFLGITNIKAVGSKKVKITFDTITNSNICLHSDILRANGFHVNIPGNLIYSYGIIKLDNNISEKEFFKGHRSSVIIDSFKPISIQKDGQIYTDSHSRIEVQSTQISIPHFHFQYVIRSNSKLLRFGHTQKYCRSDARRKKIHNDRKYLLQECGERGELIAGTIGRHYN